MSEIDGRWDLEIETIRGKQKTGTLDISTDGETVSGALIGERMTLEFDNGRRKGNAVRWKSDVSIPMFSGKRTVTCTFTVDGDTISGTIDGPKQKLATCKGSRSE